MIPSISTLGDILSKNSQYLIPVFQRGYRWELPQWEKFWASLIEIQRPAKIGNHFMGFLVFVPGVPTPGQDYSRFHLVDGQQRLTTSSLLLLALRNVASRMEQQDLVSRIHGHYLVHALGGGKEDHRLVPKAQDGIAYSALVRSKPAAGRMADALAYFETRIDEFSQNDSAKLRQLLSAASQRFEFMCATLQAENAYSIFKSLNSTGVPLGQSDLIRNFVFMHVHPDAQDDFDREHWAPLEAMFPGEAGRLDEERFSRFFRDVLMAEGQYVQPKDTFNTFEARFEATGFNPAVLAEQLAVQARDYASIAGWTQHAEPAVNAALAGLNRLESSTTYPLLLALFAAHDAGRLTSAELADCIDMLAGFIFRRFVSGESSRGYGQMFVRAIDGDTPTPMAALKHYLLDRGWPHDARFIEAFNLFPLYKRGYAREVLEVLERRRGHKEQAGLELAQIEHVMPQTLSAAWIEELGDEPERVHADWLHRPGNLTLTAYNQEVGNQSFAVKSARFKQSNIGLTREVSTRTQWTETEIQERGLQLANEAAKAWSGPKEAHASEDVAVQLQETRAVRTSFWTAFAGFLADKHPELPPFEPSFRRAVRLRTGVPHVSQETRYKVQEDSVAMDVYFHRKALKLWERLRTEPDHVNAMVGEDWTFELSPKGEYAWMTLARFASSSDPAHWPALHAWLGQKLAQVQEHLLPYLREEIQVLLPSAMTKSSSDDGDGPTATKLQQQRFWGVLAQAVSARSNTLRPQKPLPQHWTNYAIGRSGFSITPTVNSRDDRIGVELVIGSSNAKEQFQALLAQRESIEAGLGFEVEWQEMPDRIMSRVGCWREDSPPEDESRWPEYVEWLSARILKLEEVFRPLVRALP